MTTKQTSNSVLVITPNYEKIDPELIPLSKVEGLPVDKFSFDLLPESIEPWARDIQKRLQCPADYVGVGLMIALATVTGNKITVQPKANDFTWKVVPNLWGLLVGEPSSMKTPAMSESLQPIIKIDENLRARRGQSGSYTQRLVVRDSTLEKVQIIQGNNPTGILLIQDEIAALFKKFDQPTSGYRQYLLEAFNGSSSYSVDRVTKNRSVFIEKNTLSLIGTIQPDVLQSMSFANGVSNDGFMQRLQLAVWPDAIPHTYVDEAPNLDAAEKAYKVLFDLYTTHERTLCFAEDAQASFEGLYKRSMALTDALSHEGQNDLASHITKYGKLVPALSLLIELGENTHSKSVSLESISKAIEWVDYLVTHAKRIYGIQDPTALIAQKILDKKDRLNSTFTPSEVVQNNWKGLTKTQEVRLGIELLAKHNYLIKIIGVIGSQGGRPSERYRWNDALN